MNNTGETAERTVKTIGIVGGGKGGSEILKFIAGIAAVRVLFVVDVNAAALAFATARELGIPTSTNLELTLKSNPADFIIEATGSRKVYEKIAAVVPDSTEILGSRSALLIFNMLDESRRTANLKVKEEIETIREEIVNETSRVSLLLQDINGITVGMKVLALNASVEAARYGTGGKGFGVVAEEIKSISERTRALALSIERINESIVEMSNRIDISLEHLK